MILRELIAKFGLDFDEKSFKKADSAINDLKANAQRLVAAIAVFEIGKTLKNLVETTIDYADQTSKAAEKIGVTTEALEELRYAGDLAGLSAEELDRGLTLFTKKAGDAGNGSSDAVKAFAELGISIHDANGKIKTSDVLLGSVADKMKAASSKTERLRIAMDFFGAKGGSKFVALLKDGSSGLNDARLEAEQLGAVFSGDFGRAAEAFNDNLTRIGYVARGIKNSVVEALLPTLSEVVDSSLAWIKANRDLIKTKVTQYVTSFAQAAKRVGGYLFTVARVFAALVDGVGGFDNALTALGVALGVMLVAQIGEAVIGFAALNATMLVTKLAMLADALLMGAAFIILAGVIGLVGEEIESLFDSKKQGLFETMVGKWADFRSDLIDGAVNAKTWWGSVLYFIGSVVAGLIQKIDYYFGGIFKALTLFGELFDNVVFAIETAPTRLMSAWRDFFKFVDRETPDWLKGAANFVGAHAASFGAVAGTALINPSGAAMLAGNLAGKAISNSVSVNVDASGQSLDEAQVADLVSRHVDNALTNANAIALQALTPTTSGQ